MPSVGSLKGLKLPFVSLSGFLLDTSAAAEILAGQPSALRDLDSHPCDVVNHRALPISGGCLMVVGDLVTTAACVPSEANGWDTQRECTHAVLLLAVIEAGQWILKKGA